LLLAKEEEKNHGSLLFLVHQYKLSENTAWLFSVQITRWLKSTLDTEKMKILSPNKIRGMERTKLLSEKYVPSYEKHTVSRNCSAE